ncbi:MAG TPA: FeoA family protein [Spirochaetota bacterium]|nr:FeoA family protein [Spirochaetota bacterium]
MIINLTELKVNQQGIIESLRGGRGMYKRLNAMGIRPGMNIKKISAQFMRGPVVVKAGEVQLALGFRMARKIYVKVNEQEL